MGITIKEIALELGITKQAVQSRMNDIDNFRQKYTTKSGNKLIVNDEGYKLLSSGNNKKISNLSIGLNALVAEQIKDQKAQINKQNNQINELHKMLNDAHKIHLKLLNENNNLKERVKVYEKQTDVDEDNENIDKKNKPIFSRLFHK
ncbi:hypothetical protein [Apilactobacillus ozensis]|uniref:DUF536 domain-containing protein n=1 Tax=Apilactobacillus ozensis DSM 23829 = JCM 17196 TaxID=1423781 RepID=A0A0R2AL71_9LACO|nr:hypothetical protein [Apilactobacillus ozensis]KRM67639.1 hypothetical protein FD06_GL000791 [Apilactobacillus ozensis DSM 23829 = JCM 17196]MCK8607150.1 hypothetical protein [Apilactobacillus ozensis]